MTREIWSASLFLESPRGQRVDIGAFADVDLSDRPLGHEIKVGAGR